MPRSFLLDRRTWPGQAAQRRMLDRDPRDISRFDLSTFLSAPVSASETSTIGKPMKGATESEEVRHGIYDVIVWLTQQKKSRRECMGAYIWLFANEDKRQQAYICSKHGINL